ncbi:hypothetical protein [Sphingomonas sp. ERG5]|uniref:hypothetical protein n=1 Tax=Sphingomonas sp. ERG5 TaxID=1381597 RepID=UPI000B2EE315|nr:hypothetical protein [Sphingomonas sp. ERG5]
MFRGMVKGAMALAAAMLLIQPAAAGWLQARSKHFVIYSEASDANLHDFATRLEQLDAALRALSRSPDRDGVEANPVTIFLLPNIDAIRTLYSNRPSEVGGFYLPRAEGSVAFAPLSTAERTGLRDHEIVQGALSPTVILYHEYGHHFLLGHFTAAYPSWFSEGYAEVVSTATVKGNEVVIGNAANHRAGSLFSGKSLSIEQLLASSQQRMTADQVAEVYARGWLMTHFVMFNDERVAKFSAYLKLLNSGTPSLDAARQAFGDLKQLDHDLQKYLSSRLPGKLIKLDDVPSITIETVSEGASAMMDARMRSARGVDSERAKKVFAQGKSVAARYPDDPVVQTWFAEMAYDAGEELAAEAAADRALARDPKSIPALLYKARVLLRRAEAAKADAKTWSAARNWVVKANHVDPNNAPALLLYYFSFQHQGTPPPPSAITGLRKAFYLVPQDPELRLLVARQDIMSGDSATARQTLAPLAYDPHAAIDNPAARLIADLAAGKSGQDALTAFDAAVEHARKADTGEKE